MKGNKTKSSIYIVLSVVIFLSLVRIIYSFVFLKDDFHSDEIWSYGLSNSYYEPFIYKSADQTELINCGKWLPSQVMRDYLTVSENHRFAYDSVYYNQICDYHPPLYYLILHTICSFFPGRFSPWFGFSINITVFCITMLYIYKLFYQISKVEWIAVVGCAFYGFSVSAVNTFVFVRMYCLLTMLSVIALYYHSKLYQNQFNKKNLLILFFITLMGCLTHHFYIPYAGSISICFCVYYILKKEFKKFGIYSFTMLVSVALSVILFPATIDHLFSGRINDAKLPFSWQFKITLNCMLRELFGVSVSVISPVSYPALLIAFACILVILSPLVFLFRNEEWFKSFIDKSKNLLLKAFARIRNIDLMVVCIIVSSFEAIILTALTVAVFDMGGASDRYICNIFPSVVIVFFILILNLSRLIVKNNKKVFVFCVLVGVLFGAMNNHHASYNYFFTKPEGHTPVKSVVDDSDCILITEDTWLLTCFTKDFLDADNIYVLDIGQEGYKMPEPLAEEGELFVLIDENAIYKNYEDGALENGGLPEREMSKDQSYKLKKEDFEALLQNKYSMCDYIGFDTAMGRLFSIYRVK